MAPPTFLGVVIADLLSVVTQGVTAMGGMLMVPPFSYAIVLGFVGFGWKIVRGFVVRRR